MRIVFVGIHNKPHLTALDSSTLSGKTIDAVIAQLPDHECVKTNLYDREYLPNGDEARRLEDEWFCRVQPRPDDVIVLLGNLVQYTLSRRLDCKTIAAAHPSLQFSKVKRPDYIASLVARVTSTTRAALVGEP